MHFIDSLPTTLADMITAGRWSSPRSGTLLRHARLLGEARRAGRMSDDLVDTLVVAARTEIAACGNPLPIMTVMLEGLRDWQASARSAACRGFVEHGGYANADQALAVAQRILGPVAPARAA